MVQEIQDEDSDEYVDKIEEEQCEIEAQYYLTLLHMGGGVFKTQVAFDAILDSLGVKIECRYFLTIPKYKPIK